MRDIMVTVRQRELTMEAEERRRSRQVRAVRGARRRAGHVLITVAEALIRSANRDEENPPCPHARTMSLSDEPFQRQDGTPSLESRGSLRLVYAPPHVHNPALVRSLPACQVGVKLAHGNCPCPHQ
jgi:hypothetical protein